MKNLYAEARAICLCNLPADCLPSSTHPGRTPTAREKAIALGASYLALGGSMTDLPFQAENPLTFLRAFEKAERAVYVANRKARKGRRRTQRQARPCLGDVWPRAAKG